MSNPKKEPNVLNRDGWDRFTILLNFFGVMVNMKTSQQIWSKLSVSSPAEFVKIKEKQKAWAVDNGLRVHEVNQRFSFLIITKDFHEYYQRFLFLIISKDLRVWSFFAFDLVNAYLYLQRGRGDKLMMLASQTLMVSFLSCSKLEMAKTSPPTYYQFAVM